MTTAASPTYNTATRHVGLRRKGARGRVGTASTPNLNGLYAAHSSRVAPPAGLLRKPGPTVLTQNSLAAIPNDNEYALNSLNGDTMPLPSPMTPKPSMSGAVQSDVQIGDMVDVPGSMTGTVRFIGSVQGRKGMFAGVELHGKFATRGKNSGEVDGISYFTTTQAGAGIFVPLGKALKRDSLPNSVSSYFSATPFGNSFSSAALKAGNQNSMKAPGHTPPTPSQSRFSQSVGPGRTTPAKAKILRRPSLPRPESPVRRAQLTPGLRLPSGATPGLATARGPTRFGSPGSAPTTNKYGQSLRAPTAATEGDPTKGPGGRGLMTPQMLGKNNLGPRSVSALGGSVAAANTTDDETTLVATLGRARLNGGVAPTAWSGGLKMATSRAASRAGNRAATLSHDEVDELRMQLEERNRQLREQAVTLAEMENSLTELQGLIEASDGLSFGNEGGKDVAALRTLMTEKNEKMAMLTAEFDAHRADFRSTIDTLEMASAETERVYEQKIEELMHENHDLNERMADVNQVAVQLKQLEDLVQDLEEGLEDARRGEAEARGELEFLRGEVERTRAELRREREKAQQASGGTVNGLLGIKGSNGGERRKELEAKEDEIRGLKAIIHSLSRDSVPSDNTLDRASTDEVLAREDLERGLVTHSNSVQTRGSGIANGTHSSSMRTSPSTVMLAPTSPESPLRRRLGSAGDGLGPTRVPRSRGSALDTMPESDSLSTATENDALWCDICETTGHDILGCTNMFGSDKQLSRQHQLKSSDSSRTGKDYVRTGLKKPKVPGPHGEIMSPPLSFSQAKLSTALAASGPASASLHHNLPIPTDLGPVAGKESGKIDASKWCAVCERDGHDSVDCPSENAL